MSRQQLVPATLIVCALAAVLFLFTGKGTESLIETATAASATTPESVSTLLQESSAGASSCHVGPPYQSYTGTDAIANPPVPPLIGPAGSKIYETEFPVQNQIVRVTDENTAALLKTSDGAFTVVGAALTNRWSPDDTHFVVKNSSQYFIYNFDPKCSDATYMNAAPDNFNNHSALAPFFNPVFNAVAVPPIVYGIAESQFQSCTHNHSNGTCPASVAFDVSAHPSIPPLYVAGLAGLSATRDQDSNIALAAAVNFRPEPPGCTVNCTGQDLWDGVVVCVRNYDALGHNGCVYWDSYLGNLGGDFGPQCTACPGLPQGMLLHAAKINAREDGLLTDLWIEGSAPITDTLHGSQFWNVGTSMFVHFTVAAGGHGVTGNTFFVNQSNGYNGDARSWLIRPFLLVTPTELIPNPPAPKLGAQDGHPALANGLAYVYQNMYQPLSGNCMEATAWACENLAIQINPLPLPGKNATVRRFIHNWSFAAERSLAVPHGEVSPDGKFMCFNSDWGGTLSAGRSDVFCNEMK